MSETSSTSTPPRPSAIHRYAGRIKWVSVALIAVSALVIFKSLPDEMVREGLAWFRRWIDGLGFWGAVIYAVIYIVAVVVLAPGSILTLLAGALFGLLGGTILVSIASNIGAALAFLIARYFAREAVAAKLKGRPKFAAVDRAISEGGWKVVAMLRLSPAIPFNLQNYMYGLTGIRFWTCVLTSWVAMLPGTFMYVYAGHFFGVAIGQPREKTVGEWIALGVGLAATVAVTVYITKLAKKKLDEQTQIGGEGETHAAGDDQPADHGRKRSGVIGAAAACVLAMVAVTSASIAVARPQLLEQWIKSLAGPPAVVMREAYQRKPDGPAFDHSAFDALLRAHVDEHGWVDYEALSREPAPLDAYIESLAAAPFDEMGRDQKLALLINAYNACTLRLVLDHYDLVKDHPHGIQAIPKEQRWDARRWKVGGHTWSLNQIEHEQVRPNFIEPRIHFALVCAAESCPKLRDEAFVAGRLDEQLQDQAEYVHRHERWLRYDAAGNTVYLTMLYHRLWYASDFEQVEESQGSVLKYVSLYSQPVKAALGRGEPLSKHWIEYSWRLNSMANAP